MANWCFFTVCGGGEDYEFLLGSIRHHATMGQHVVLDTTPSSERRIFRNLPASVHWVYDPAYGQGWKTFRFRDALMKAIALARPMGDILVCLDCDEFYSKSIMQIEPFALQAALYVETIHWRRDRLPYMYGESEWHMRIWPAAADVSYPPNQAWVSHPNFNGNDHHHAVPRFPAGMPFLKVPGLYHHHLHHALGKKSLDEKNAAGSIPNWGCGIRTIAVPWPVPLSRWYDDGVLPSVEFQ